MGDRQDETANPYTAPSAPLPAGDPARSFSFIDLMATLAIIGVLIALLLPAVQSTRHSARRVRGPGNPEAGGQTESRGDREGGPSASRSGSANGPDGR